MRWQCCPLVDDHFKGPAVATVDDHVVAAAERFYTCQPTFPNVGYRDSSVQDCAVGEAKFASSLCHPEPDRHLPNRNTETGEDPWPRKSSK